MAKQDNVEIAIIGAGFVGIATAYYLCQKYQRKSVLLIDSREPMSYTSAQSGDNYRNWWPSREMTQFTNDSINLMHDIARESSNVLNMQQRGYALATRRKDVCDLMATLNSNFDDPSKLVRQHFGSSSSSYIDPHSEDWANGIDGVDVVSNAALIQETFPAFSAEIQNVVHIRKAGDISGQQMGEFMLQKCKSLGLSRLRGKVTNIRHDGGYQLEVDSQDEKIMLDAEIVVNAAGPYIADIANMLGTDLPVKNIFHQKLAFEDVLSAVPREQPFSIDIDETTLDWNLEDAASLAQDPSLSWLTKAITGGIHCRPEGKGRWIKLGWAYNRTPSAPDYSRQLIEDPQYNPSFPEIVMRGAAKLNPKLEPYIESLPHNRVHYGGYYTMTEENWPLIGPLDDAGAFIAGALSGFGSMGACAAGALCADWICGGRLPEYAHSLSLARYQDAALLRKIAESNDIGLL
jgi:glycine/D-amino acid oxidase-like deaminating enzyme